MPPNIAQLLGDHQDSTQNVKIWVQGTCTGLTSLANRDSLT